MVLTAAACTLHCSPVLQVTLVEHGDREVALTIRGLTEYGYLLAVDGMGTAFALHPDGNR